MILRVAYGYEIEPENDYYVALADEAMKGLTQAANPGALYFSVFGKYQLILYQARSSWTSFPPSNMFLVRPMFVE